MAQRHRATFIGSLEPCATMRTDIFPLLQWLPITLSSMSCAIAQALGLWAEPPPMAGFRHGEPHMQFPFLSTLLDDHCVVCAI